MAVIRIPKTPTSAFNKNRPISKLLKSPILVKSLSPKGDMVEIAHGLFSTMRELDASPVSIILVEPCLAKEGVLKKE